MAIPPEDVVSVIEDFVDYLMPELTPTESSLYLLLLRMSFLRNGTLSVVVGKRTVAKLYGRGIRGERTNMGHIAEVSKKLEEKGCVVMHNISREGTEYEIVLPRNIASVAEKIATSFVPSEPDDDFFHDPENRKSVFERDSWTCQYCGERLTPEDATLDHYVPQSKGGSNAKENLKTCCFPCNSIKSGKTYEEAAPAILQYVQSKRSKGGRSL